MTERDFEINPDDSSLIGIDKDHVAPGTGIRYKETLIEKYLTEHGNIRNLYHDVLSAYQSNNAPEFVRLLELLHNDLRSHLLDEALNMYIYLKHYYTRDEKKLDMIQRFNRNMKKSFKQVFTFIRRFTEEGEAVRHDPRLLLQLIEMGNSLEVQFSAEERHLFCLYQRPQATPA
ncbi:MAG: hypothetical protein OEZ39_19525 [Gammaproteobacteria bacterium]|nr:hypothetical protein [Gammaproteobacteria bacterium]MDH5654057.1 hypothetical protein [Gammaproteobacteria bacterium]